MRESKFVVGYLLDVIRKLRCEGGMEGPRAKGKDDALITTPISARPPIESRHIIDTLSRIETFEDVMRVNVLFARVTYLRLAAGYPRTCESREALTDRNC